MTLGNVHLTPQLVEAVRDAADILDIAGEVTTLKRRGKRYLGLCPFHKEKTPSFSVDPEQGLFYCFGCGVGGDAIKLAMHHTGDDFPAAIESLAQRYGIPLPSRRSSARRGPDRADPTRALELANTYFRSQLKAAEYPSSYLVEREIPADLIERFGLGYAPDGWESMVDELRRTVSVEELEAAGLAGRSEHGRLYARFRHRLMFPISNLAGRIVGFGGRTLGDDRAKYVNTSETERFRKSELLYGFHVAKLTIRERRTAVLVEGYFDVLAMVACGISWTVAAMGTSLTTQQAKILARYCDAVILVYDGDKAGKEAGRRALPILLAEGIGVKQVNMPEGLDPDTFRLERSAEELRELVDSARDSVELAVDELVPAGSRLEPTELSKAADSLAGLLAGIRDPLTRYAYSQRAAERMGVPIDMVLGRRNPSRRQLRPPAAAAAEDASSTKAPTAVRSQEEHALSLLLSGASGIVPEDLPPAEIFFDRECRNIYLCFCALYKDGEGRVPTAREVVAKLGDELGGKLGVVDRAARLLLEEPSSGEDGLPRTLDRLLHRWRKQRQVELIRQIRDAQMQGDHDRLAGLLDEKRSLSRSLHPEMTGKL